MWSSSVALRSTRSATSSRVQARSTLMLRPFTSAAARIPKRLLLRSRCAFHPFSLPLFVSVLLYFGLCLGLNVPRDGRLTPANRGCVISVTGFYITGQQIPSTTFSFAPTKAEGAPLVLGVFPSTYVALKNLTLALAAGGAVGDFTNTVLTIDDFVHCNYS